MAVNPMLLEYLKRQGYEVPEKRDYAYEGANRDQLISGLSRLSSSAGSLGGKQAEYIEPQDFSAQQAERSKFAQANPSDKLQEYLMKKLTEEKRPGEWRESSKISSTGRRVYYNPVTGEEKEGDLVAQPEQKETWSSTGRVDDLGNLILVSNLGREKTGPKVGEAQNTKATVVDTQAKDFAKAASEIQDLGNSLANLEQELGFNLEDANLSGDRINVKGREQDLPGFNVPIVGRVTAHSSSARAVDAIFKKLMNVTLKERSGAAVTANELDRLKVEYEAGRFNTESDMIRGLQRLKKAINQDFINLKAGYRPESIAEYGRRGGQTDLPSPYIKEPGKKYGISDGAAMAAPPVKKKEEMSNEELQQYIEFLKVQK